MKAKLNKTDPRIKLSVSGQAFFKSRHSNEYQADASRILYSVFW
jgi:hypothetical protein